MPLDDHQRSCWPKQMGVLYKSELTMCMTNRSGILLELSLIAAFSMARFDYAMHSIPVSEIYRGI